jgi:hypothetical protein
METFLILLIVIALFTECYHYIIPVIVLFLGIMCDSMVSGFFGAGISFIILSLIRYASQNHQR